jgi:hypothetical protein
MLWVSEDWPIWLGTVTVDLNWANDRFGVDFISKYCFWRSGLLWSNVRCGWCGCWVTLAFGDFEEWIWIWDGFWVIGFEIIRFEDFVVVWMDRFELIEIDLLTGGLWVFMTGWLTFRLVVVGDMDRWL